MIHVYLHARKGLYWEKNGDAQKHQWSAFPYPWSDLRYYFRQKESAITL